MKFTWVPGTIPRHTVSKKNEMRVYKKTKYNLYLILFLLMMPGAMVHAQAGASEFAYPQSVFIDSKSGHLWAADFSNNRVLRFDISNLTGVMNNDNPAIPGSFSLDQNYPNPFNSQTVITFRTGGTSEAELSIADPAGRTVSVLFRGTAEKGRQYRCSFNADRLSSGIYYYMLRTPDGLAAKKMCLLK